MLAVCCPYRVSRLSGCSCVIPPLPHCRAAPRQCNEHGSSNSFSSTESPSLRPDCCVSRQFQFAFCSEPVRFSVGLCGRVAVCLATSVSAPPPLNPLAFKNCMCVCESACKPYRAAPTHNWILLGTTHRLTAFGKRCTAKEAMKILESRCVT